MTKVKLLIGTLLLFFLSTDGVHVALKNNGTYCLIMDSAIISGEITYISVRLCIFFDHFYLMMSELRVSEIMDGYHRQSGAELRNGIIILRGGKVGSITYRTILIPFPSNYIA